MSPLICHGSFVLFNLFCTVLSCVFLPFPSCSLYKPWPYLLQTVPAMLCSLLFSHGLLDITNHKYIWNDLQVWTALLWCYKEVRQWWYSTLTEGRMQQKEHLSVNAMGSVWEVRNLEFLLQVHFKLWDHSLY